MWCDSKKVRAPALAAALRERSALRDTILFDLFVVVVVIAVLFVKRRPGRAENAVGLGIPAIYVTAWLRIGSLEERTHLFEYGLVAALVHEALLERRENGRRVPRPVASALVISILLGWIDEGIQSILPSRVYDIRDVLFNSVAVIMVIGARWALAFVRRWAQARRRDG